MRLKSIIEQNSSKMKLISNYKKVSQEISSMFQIIASHTGKEDITHLVEEFVDKEKIIFKLDEQVSNLEQQVIEKEKRSERKVAEK